MATTIMNDPSDRIACYELLIDSWQT